MKQDTITKKLFEDKDIFASFINGVIYQGKNRLLGKGLKECSLSTINENFQERRRDVLQAYQFQGQIFAIYHLESQSVIDFSMVFRMMEYQAALYLKKYKENQRHRDKLPPIVSVVFYTGKEEWKEYKSLYECVQVSQELREWISDYRIHVFSCAQNEIEFEDTDLNFFVWGIKYSYQDKWENLIDKFKDKIIKKGTLKMLSRMCGQKEELKDMEEKVNVSHELGSYQRRMINLGKEEGIHEGYQQGARNTQEQIREKMRTLGYTKQQIDEICGKDTK